MRNGATERHVSGTTHGKPGRPVLRALAEQLRKREVSAEELLRQSLQIIRERDRELHAFLHVAEALALAQARSVDERRAADETLPLLAGIPYAVKDIICTAGLPTTAASRILDGFVPPYDATVIERLRAHGAVLAGKTNLDEFAMGSSTEFSAFGPTKNPRDLERVPGGSSGGSAAAVAAGMVPYALGTDTGGSVRLPAAFCGIVGMKPTYGRVSRYGVIAYASSFDQVGPFARSVEDAALVLDAIAGPDPRDATTLPASPSLADHLERGVQGLRIGVPEEFFPSGIDADVAASVRDAVGMLADLGAEVSEVRLPSVTSALAAYYILVTAEASTNLARYDGVRFGRRATPRGGAERRESLEDLYRATRGEGFGADVKRRILLGTFVLSAGYADRYYRKAAAARHAIAQDFARVFETVDVLVCPAAPELPFRLGEKVQDPLTMYASDALTVPVNVAGLPALSVPCGDVRGLPVGLQIIAAQGREDLMVRVGAAYERARGPWSP